MPERAAMAFVVPSDDEALAREIIGLELNNLHSTESSTLKKEKENHGARNAVYYGGHPAVALLLEPLRNGGPAVGL